VNAPGAKAQAPQRKRGKFHGDVLRLASGTGIGQVIGILAAPVITRLFAPEAYGVAAVFASLTAILSVVACARYELAIVLPKEDVEAANLFWLSTIVALIFSSLTGFFTWIVGPTVLVWIDAPELAPFLWLIPVAVLLHGLFIALNYWNTRTGHFARLSIASVTSRVTGTAVTLGAGFAGFATAGAMIIASIFGRALATVVLGGQIFRDNGRFLIQNFDWRAISFGMKRHRKFPLFSSWAGLINIASWQLPIILFGTFFSPAIVGFYALGFRILQMPMSLIGQAIGRVFHQRAAEAHVRGDLDALVRNLLRLLLIAGLAPLIVLAVIGEDLFAFAFGANWAEAGLYAQILSPWALVWFISSPLSTLFGVLEQQAKGLRLQVTIFGSRLVSIAVGAYYENIWLALGLLSATGILVYGSLVWKIMRLSGVSISSMIDAGLLKALASGLAILAVLSIVKLTPLSELLIIGIGLVLISAYFFLMRRDLMSNPIAEYAA
jgi:O-antigen/teichoic acid export membrane protein